MSWREKLNIKQQTKQLGGFRLSASKEKKLSCYKQLKSMKSSFSSSKNQIIPSTFSNKNILVFQPLKLNTPNATSLKEIHIQFKDKKNKLKTSNYGLQPDKNVTKNKRNQSQCKSISSGSDKFDNFPAFNLKNSKITQLQKFKQLKSQDQLNKVKSQKVILRPPLMKLQDPFICQQTQSNKKQHQRSLTTNQVKNQKTDEKRLDFSQMDLSELLKSLRTTANSKNRQSKQKAYYLQKNSQRLERKFKKLELPDFQIGKTLGKGQFGQVKLIRHKQTGFICAMKIMRKNTLKQYNYVFQVIRQIGIQSYIAHRNIAPLYGYFDDKQNLYLLVEYCGGGQLYEKIKKQKKIDQQTTSRIIKQVLEGLDYLHKLQIIHRDLKPQNILFNHGVPKISDFGWAIFHNQQSRKTTSGSPLYYAPQIVKGESYDQKMDLWNIGMMTYQCLMGRIPFKIFSQLDLFKIVSDQVKFPSYAQVSEKAKDFILKIMNKNPSQRMQIRQMFRHQFIKQFQQKNDANLQEEFNQIFKY